MGHKSILEPLHAAADTICKGECSIGTGEPSAAAVGALRAAVASLAAARPQLQQAQAEGVWRCCCELWNACVELANTPAQPLHDASSAAGAAPPGGPPCDGIAHARCAAAALMRQSVCEVLAHLENTHLAEEEHVTRLGFALKSAQEWATLSNFQAAEAVLGLASPWAAVFEEAATEEETPPETRSRYRALAFDVHMAHMLVAWRLGQEELAGGLVERCRAIIDAQAEPAAAPALASLRLRLAAALQRQCTEHLAPLARTDGAACGAGPMEAGAAAEGPSRGVDAAGVSRCAARLTLAYELLQSARDVLAAADSADTGEEGRPDPELQAAHQLEGQVLLSLGLCHQLLDDAPAALACARALRRVPARAGTSAAPGALSAPPDLTAHPAVSLLAFWGHLAAGDLAAAQGEALGIVAAEEAGREGCLAVALELMREEHAVAADALGPVLDLVLGRFPRDCSLLASLAHAALDGPCDTPPAASAAPGGAAAQAAGLGEREGMLLGLLEAHPSFAQAAAAPAEGGGRSKDGGAAGGDVTEAADGLMEEGPTEGREAAYGVLCGHAARLFQARRFGAAVQFYSAAMAFAEASSKAVLCRCAALCHMGLGAGKRAAEMVRLAEDYQPRQVATSFMRFKLALDAGDGGAAIAEVEAMVGCDGFEPAMLQMACQEALGARAGAEAAGARVARAALQQLHALLVSAADARARAADASAGAGATTDDPKPAADCSGDGNEGAPTAAGADPAAGGKAECGQSPAISEAAVLRCLVRLDADALAAALAGAGRNGAASPGGKRRRVGEAGASEGAGERGGADVDAGGAGGAAALRAALKALCGSLHLAARRATALGAAVFVGAGEAQGGEALAWLAGVAWNAGLDAAEAREFESVAVLMAACAELAGLHPAPGPRDLQQQRMAYLVAASAALEVHKSGDTKQRKQSLGLASRMVANSRRAAERLAAAEAAAAPAAGHGAADAGNNAAGAAAGGGRGTLADAFTALQEFGIAARRNDAEGLMAALGRAAALGCVGGEQLAAHGGGGGGPRVQVLRAALSAALQKLMARGAPDWARVALVVRQMAGAAAGDDDRTAVFEEGARILGLAPPEEGEEPGGDGKASGGYPEREARWLAGSCWNAGLARLRAGDKAAAGRYLAAGLAMARRLPRWGALDRAAMERLAAEVAGPAAAAAGGSAC